MSIRDIKSKIIYFLLFSYSVSHIVELELFTTSSKNKIVNKKLLLTHVRFYLYNLWSFII